MSNPRKVPPPSSRITPHAPSPETAPADQEALEGEAPPLPPAAPAKGLPPAVRAGVPLPWVIALVVVLGGAAVAMPFVLPVVQKWLERAPVPEAAAQDEKADKTAACELVLDGAGKPVDPPALRLSAEAARTLRLSPEPVKASKRRPLPPLEGNLAYTNASLFPVRPRFAGEVISISEVSPKIAAEDVEVSSSGSVKPPPLRSLDFGDAVQKGEILAVIWSKDLGTAKATLVDAISNLRWSTDTLKRETKTYEEGALPLATLRAAERQVRLDTNALLTAERTLRMWKLTDAEIDAIKRAAETIEQAKRDPKKETKWARVEVKAPHDGVIVEKNTNVGDWVDPVNGNPMFRIADLNTLAAWVTPMEEYLPLLRKLMKKKGPDRLTWKVELHAEPHAEPLWGPVTRIAPSLDPINHSLLVMGPIPNPERRLLVGQFITATIFVPPDKDLVEIPTTALNEDGEQSLVFVQPHEGKDEFEVRRVAVTNRFKDVVFVRSVVAEAPPKKQSLRGPRPIPDEMKDFARKKKPEKQSLRGPWPIRALRPGERVVTKGVPMLTAALRDLLTKEEAK